MSLKESFGRRLKQLREERGIKQDALAESVCVSDGRVIRFWESGGAGPEFDNLEKLAEALDVPVWKLFYFDDTS